VTIPNSVNFAMLGSSNENAVEIAKGVKTTKLYPQIARITRRREIMSVLKKAKTVSQHVFSCENVFRELFTRSVQIPAGLVNCQSGIDN
jgi:hypothetical protein